jgi:phage anti-repressor protein
MEYFFNQDSFIEHSAYLFSFRTKGMSLPHYHLWLDMTKEIDLWTEE